MSFSPGELTAREVAQLREMLRQKEAFTRLSVSPPLNLTRAAGIPNIGIDLTTEGEVLIAEVDSSTGTPPVHTVTVQTRNTSNALIDSTPTQTITKVLNFRAISTAIPNGSIVEIFPIPGSVGWWWADYTASSSLTVKEADGSPSYSSITTIQFDSADGFVASNPSAGVAQIDIAAATRTQAGVVSTSDQTWDGEKGADAWICTDGTYIYGSVVSATPTDASNWTANKINGKFCALKGELGGSAGPIYAYVGYANSIAGLILDCGTAGCAYMVTEAGTGNIYTGQSGTFTTTDGKTVTVKGGIITSIV